MIARQENMNAKRTASKPTSRYLRDVTICIPRNEGEPGAAFYFSAVVEGRTVRGVTPIARPGRSVTRRSFAPSTGCPGSTVVAARRARRAGPDTWS
jgi:hypothetical protein